MKSVAGIGAELWAALGSALRGRASARQIALVYLLLLFTAIGIGLARWPIVAVDTDLWYHMTAGRQMVAERGIPSDAFFSFLRPSPQHSDTTGSWLSQVVLYGTQALGGPLALIALRAALALATLGFALALLRVGRGRDSLPYSALILTIAALFVLGRELAIRPHMASHLLLAVFLYLLESRRAMFAWPVLALLWSNLHGIEYPVMLLVLGAYGGEWLLARLSGVPAGIRATLGQLGAVAVAALCVLVTPKGLALLPAPFTELSFASRYIEELRPVPLASLFSFQLDGLLLSGESLRSAILLLASIAALASLRRAALRPAHLVLFAGGLVLLVRMERFSTEFILLSLPLLGAFRPPLVEPRGMPKWLGVALVVLAAALPARFLVELFDTRCSFPVCTRDLPTGTVAFLNQVDARGDVLNHPNDGGYLEWELQPRQKIFVDLQTPLLFPDAAIFSADQAFQDPVVLGSVIGTYRPAFLVVPNKLRGFPALVARFPDYVPVFLDDASVLYASASQNPALVERYQLRAIEPFSVNLVGSPDDPATLARAAAELQRIHEIHPDAGRTGIFEAVLALERGDVDFALRRAAELRRTYPHRPEPYRLHADALFRAKRFAEAAEAYRIAIARLGDEAVTRGQRLYLEGQRWKSLVEVGDFEAAYHASRSAVPDIYQPSVDANQLVSLAQAALQSGRVQEGRRLLEFALQKTPMQETGLRSWIQTQLATIPR